MGDTDLNEVRALYKRLRELVIRNPGGWDDADSRARIEALCNAGIAALDDAECHGRLRAADYLRLQILIALEAVNTRLFFIGALRGRESISQP